mgnify:CR=1 FL=1
MKGCMTSLSVCSTAAYDSITDLLAVLSNCGGHFVAVLVQFAGCWLERGYKISLVTSKDHAFHNQQAQ